MLKVKLYQVKIQLGKGLNLNGDKSKTFESVRIRSTSSFSLNSFAVVGVVGGTSVVEVLMVVYDILDS